MTKRKTTGKTSSKQDSPMPQNHYDAVPYESYPYPNTHPERLYTIGKLFGMQPVDFKKCKVLELGCASGGNLIPMATQFPESNFVGVDLSEVQVKQGQEHIKSLGLENITLKHMSITDIDEKFGKFDYIVVHGILSWVPKNVQDKIFEVCSKNLSKNGVSYISYNTLPGWNAIKSIREMMLFHTRNFAKPEDKVREARLLLKFIKEANAGNQTAYAQVIDTEIKTLSECVDSYLLHDHLEENNEPFYFHNIAEKAFASGLQYLGETAISSMFIGNLPGETAKILAQAASDVVKVEQYMDFIKNRRFRSTLFCHKDVQLNRNLKPETIENFYLTAHLNTTEDLDKVDLTKHKEVVINFNNGVSLKTSNNAVILAIKTLVQQKGRPMAAKELLSRVIEIIGPSANKDTVRQVVMEQILRLVLADGVGISSHPGNYVMEISGKPEASKLARYQASKNTWVTTQRSEKVNIDLFNRVLIQYLDGKNDFDTILEKMAKHVEKDELSINVNGKKITNGQEIRDALKDLTRQNIANLAPRAVLVA